MRFLDLGALAAAGLAGMVGLTGCDTSEDPYNSSAKFPGLVKLDVMPADQTLTVDPGTAAVFEYKAVGTYSNRSTTDLTKKVTWVLQPLALGGFGADSIAYRFRSSLTQGGKATVSATADVITGEARLTLLYTAAIVRVPAPADAAARFRAAQESAPKSPRLSGPADGSNLAKATPQAFTWAAAAGTDLFEVRFSNDVTDVRIYTGGTSLTPTVEEWSILASTNPGSMVQVDVRGMTSGSPGTAGLSPPIHVTFAQ